MNETGGRHSTRVHLMMTVSEPLAIEERRRQQADLPTHAEAIRRLLQVDLAAKIPPKSTK